METYLIKPKEKCMNKNRKNELKKQNNVEKNHHKIEEISDKFYGKMYEKI